MRHRNKRLRTCQLAGAMLVVLLLSHPALANTYYVDFVNGNDSNSVSPSTCGSPLQHAPGDNAAGGNVPSSLNPGDIVVFKGGVIYQGTATPSNPPRTGQLAVVVAPSSGTSSSATITYQSGDEVGCGTGKAVLDGRAPTAGSMALGFFVGSKNFITIDGLEIRNIGGPNSQQGGADAAIIDTEGGSNLIVRNSKLHDCDFTFSPGSGGYGIENNHGANHLYEKNEIYNFIDKGFEASSGMAADSNNNDANNGIARYNLIHDSASHGSVVSGNGWQVYDNLYYNIGITTANFSGRRPAFALKVDKGQGAKVWNNLAYTVNAGFGVLGGYQNEFAHNIVYGMGTQAGGEGGSDNEVALVMSVKGSNSTWPAGHKMDQNHFYNNIVYYINPVANVGDSKEIFYSNDGGSSNLVENNVFFAASGDTLTTGNRVRFNNGSDSYDSISGFQTNFNTNEGGSGNVASGNIVVDPGSGTGAWPGGDLGSFTNQPNGFNSTFTDLCVITNGVASNCGRYKFAGTSAAAISGIAVSGPSGCTAPNCENYDITTNQRGTFWPGIYDSTSGCIAAQVVFSTQPINVDLGTPDTIKVSVEDVLGHVCTSDTSTVVLTPHMGLCTGMTIGGATQGAASGGIFTTNLNFTVATGPCALDASDTNPTPLTGATSNTFTVSCTPNNLAFTGQPNNATLGASIGTVQVSVQNINNQRCSGDGSTITVANSGGTCTGMTLGGTASGSNVFQTTTLNETLATGSCTLTATDGTLTNATSNAFTISAGGGASGTGSRRLQIRGD